MYSTIEELLKEQYNRLLKEQCKKLEEQTETIKQLTYEFRNEDDTVKKQVSESLVQSIVDRFQSQSISDSIKANDELIDNLKSLLAKEKEK